MFRKLVSNLPFSPALVGHLGFYAQRLRKEQATRRLGLIFAVLAVTAQSLALLNPPQQVLAHKTTALVNDSAPQIAKHKSARNLTRNLNEADSSPAKPSERIEYILTTTNNGPSATTVTEKDELSDALEYAMLNEDGGGTFDQTTQILQWNPITLLPGQSDSKRVVLQIFDVLPTTPRAANNSTSHDCAISNTYGNTITVPIECPGNKLIENTIAQLPRTGADTNIIFALILLGTTTYFYARNKQLSKEVRLLRNDFNNGTI